MDPTLNANKGEIQGPSWLYAIALGIGLLLFIILFIAYQTGFLDSAVEAIKNFLTL